MITPKESGPRSQRTEVPGRPAAENRETKQPVDTHPAQRGLFETFPVRFGHYEIEKELGRGNMGAVYLAHDLELDRLIALKIPNASSSRTKRSLRRLRNEAKTAAKIDHPSICQVLDASEVDGQFYIALQYVEGKTLRDHLAEKASSVEQSVAIVLQLAEGLSEAHDLGIVHRDLKPENIMINRRGIPVIMDFGLAKFSQVEVTSSTTQAGTILGTPAYMSPEQAGGKIQEIDRRSDIYSLGVIFYELLTGTWPFTGSSIQVLGQKLVRDPGSPLGVKPDLNPRLAAICQKMLARRKEDRYQSLHEAVTQLKSIDFSLVTLDMEPPVDCVLKSPDAICVSDLSADRARESGACPAAKSGADEFCLTGDRTTGAVVRGSGAKAVQRVLKWWNQRHLFFKLSCWGGFGTAVVMLGVMLYFSTRYGVVQIEIEDPSLSVRFQGETITVENDRQFIYVTPTTRYTFDVLQNGVVVESASRELILKRNEKRLVKLTLREGAIWIDGRKATVVAPEKQQDTVEPEKQSAIEGKRITENKRPVQNQGSNESQHSDQNTGASPAKSVPQKHRANWISEEWLLGVQALPAERQVEAVRKGLQERNLEFDGSIQYQLDRGVVTSVELKSDSVDDLSPLLAFSHLRTLDCSCAEPWKSPLGDLSVLFQLPLRTLRYPYHTWLGAEPLRKIDSLQTINDLPAAEFWKKVDAEREADESFRSLVAASNAEEQKQAVARRLKDRNPGFDGIIWGHIQNNVLIELLVPTSEVFDISPVRALAHLQVLNLAPLPAGRSKGSQVRDITPLRGMGLRSLNLRYGHRIGDLTPLQSTSLSHLDLARNYRCTDLNQLHGMQLKSIYLWGSPQFRDLSPLRDFPLEELSFEFCVNIRDLEPIKQLHLRRIRLQGSAVRDLTPLQGMDLEEITMSSHNMVYGAEVLVTMKNLKSIRYNDKPYTAEEFWALDVGKQILATSSK